MRRLRSQAGFSLLEALVALVLLSVGLLGVAGMQLRSLQSAHSSIQRSLADLAAQDARELLWASLVANGGYCPEGVPESLSREHWREHWADFLPGLIALDEAVIARDDCAFELRIGWKDERFTEPSLFQYWVKLPARKAP
ncbi:MULTISPECIES: type IV pilus modification protein PilV [unclassified Halomonas]|uniref:type IV pilus modification protein PilV n=1 Tax=unclassified Halomonas TaxID=2609666 RepID=UPI00209E8D4A|nr:MULTISPECIES: type IV pilus modification protein PilV [unclassified Halomonas]MCJ8287667.1 type IV pilus modification protein PilV [Halomonas sp.]USZ49331.1 type IV pilus modification protein PilV [Halomonas sp. DN3]